MPSTVAGRGSLINTGFEENISQLKDRVKEKHKASMEDWEKAENMRFSGLAIKAIHMFLRALQKAVREYT